MDPDEIILMVGGPLDGKRKRWGTSQFFQKVLTATLAQPLESFYRIQFFRSETGQKHLAVHESVKDVVDLLMKGYNPTK